MSGISRQRRKYPFQCRCWWLLGMEATSIIAWCVKYIRVFLSFPVILIFMWGAGSNFPRSFTVLDEWPWNFPSYIVRWTWTALGLLGLNNKTSAKPTKFIIGNIVLIKLSRFWILLVNFWAFRSSLFLSYSNFKRLEEVISSLIVHAFHTIVPMPLPTSPHLMEPKECYRAEEARNEHPLYLTLLFKIWIEAGSN